MVVLGVAQALGHGAGGVADLQAEVPQQIEHELDDLLAPGRLLVGTQEQEIEVGKRRQLAAAVTAGRHNAQPLGGAGVGRGIGVAIGEVEQDTDDLVHQVRGGGQHGRPVVAQRAGFLEAAADLGTALGQGVAQQRQHRRPGRLAARGQVLDQRGQRFFECAAAHDLATVGNLVIGLGHGRRILQAAGGFHDSRKVHAAPPHTRCFHKEPGQPGL